MAVRPALAGDTEQLDPVGSRRLSHVITSASIGQHYCCTSAEGQDQQRLNVPARSAHPQTTEMARYAQSTRSFSAECRESVQCQETHIC